MGLAIILSSSGFWFRLWRSIDCFLFFRFETSILGMDIGGLPWPPCPYALSNWGSFDWSVMTEIDWEFLLCCFFGRGWVLTDTSETGCCFELVFFWFISFRRCYFCFLLLIIVIFWSFISSCLSMLVFFYPWEAWGLFIIFFIDCISYVCSLSLWDGLRIGFWEFWVL